MSLDVLRDGALTSRRHELASAARSQSASLRALHAVTAILSKNTNLSGLLNCQFDAENQPPLTADEESWLKSNSLLNGRRFDEASLPTPPQHHDAASIYASKLNGIPSQPPGQSQTSVGPDADPNKAPVVPTPDPPIANSNMAAAAVQKPHSIITDLAATTPTAPINSGQDAVGPDGLSVPLQDVAPPERDEEANFSNTTEAVMKMSSPHRPAKTVHLPPEEVQEERLRGAAEQTKQRKSVAEDERSSRALDVASSPSSTVGAYSAATPMPQQESPDTSPDSETAVEVPSELQPSPEERRAKEEHDRHLAAQKEIAHQQALGDVNTADDQLRWEAREAAVRDAEEKAAREELHGPEADATQAIEETEAERLADGARAVVKDSRTTEMETASTFNIERRSQSGPTDSASKSAALEEEDNITVTPRNKHSKLGSDASAKDTMMVDDEHIRPTTAESADTSAWGQFDPSRSRLVHEEQVSPSKSRPVTMESLRRQSSMEPLSPKSLRHPLDSGAADRAAVFQTPKQPSRSLPTQSTPTKVYPSLVDLSALRGAAEDPQRDYLEPLFKIQAHDAPTIRTTSLPELIRSATKNLSTDDQFTAMHERMDYRILRRIYQLQNANKWSLRQMEKCKEPEQPVTHHDHMMAEMKWMCKDFREERKMKKSVCAWLARRCADWVAAGPDERGAMQVKVKAQPVREGLDTEDLPPELEAYAESAEDDSGIPTTPKDHEQLPVRVIVNPELADKVNEIQHAGSLKSVLKQLPVWKPIDPEEVQATIHTAPMTDVSKFIGGKVLPKLHQPLRKRSRYDYEDETALLEQPHAKRLCEDSNLAPEDQEIALFRPDNKPIRDRLHANNAFRPPSEFQMPGTAFYEFRNGSQWIWEDDQKLRKLAKDYSFNWSLISDEMTLPSRFKGGMDRRTPWECFERWVELEQLPAEMRKTMYFKTWFSRLEQSQQANERRYQAQVAVIQQQQAQNPGSGSQQHVPVRKRTQPTRVEKRKNNRYLWVVDAMRKLAKKRELAAYKQAEAQRAAQQRKSSQQSDANQTRGPMLTPQQWSQKRYERDLQMAEMQRQHRQKLIEAQQRQAQMARAAQQQGMQNGVPQQHRPAGVNVAPQQGQMQVNGQQQQQQQQQQQPNINGQIPPQARQALPMATRNGHLAVPQVNSQGIPQAQMRGQQGIGQHPNMQQMAQANAQARGGQYSGQQYQMPQGNISSPGNNALSTQQQIASNQALLAAFQAQQQQPPNNANQQQGVQASNNHQISASPSMPPPPTPAGVPQQLSSGHVPAVVAIKNQLRARYPAMSEEQLTSYATEQLKHQSQSTNQVRQNAINAATGLNSTPTPATNNMQSFNHSQTPFQQNNNTMGANGVNGYPSANAVDNNNNSTNQQQAPQQQQQQQHPQQPNGMNGTASSPQHSYAQLLRQRQMQQMRMQSPSASHANMNMNGSPSMAHASPNMTPASPSMQYNNMAMQQQGGVGNAVGQQQQAGQQRPPSRNTTPQMQRLGSASSVPGVNGMQSPGAASATPAAHVQTAQAANAAGGPLQNSPRNMQASMAR